MSELQIVQISIDRVQQNESSPGDYQHTAHSCHICQQPFKTDEIRTTFSCCHALHHAECLSEWLLTDRGPEKLASLPKCTRCNAPFYPNSFYYAMAQLARRSLRLQPLTETRAVSRIRLEVRSTVEEQLYYQPAALERRALRGENPAAAQAFQPDPEARNENRINEDDTRSSPKGYGDVDEQYPGNDVESEDGYVEAQDDHQLPADDQSDSTHYESDHEDIEDIRQHPVRAAEVSDYRYGRGRMLGTDEDAPTTEHAEEAPAALNSKGLEDSTTAVEEDEDALRLTFRRHWRYGRGWTINEAPEQPQDAAGAGLANQNAQQTSQTISHTEDVNLAVPLYSFAHGRGQRLGEAPANDSTTSPPPAPITRPIIPTPSQTTQLAQQQPPAPLYSFQHGVGNRLGTGEIDAESTPYLYQPGRGRGSGLQNQLGTMGRFRHGHGRGRTFGE